MSALLESLLDAERRAECEKYVGPIDEIRGMVVIVVEADPIFPGAWLHEPPLPTRTGHSPFSTWDKNLRPIRDSDGTDETLTWSPREVTA